MYLFWPPNKLREKYEVIIYFLKTWIVKSLILSIFNF